MQNIRKLTLIMVGMTLSYGILAWYLPISIKPVDTRIWTILCGLSICNLIAAIVSTRLVNPMSPPAAMQVRLIVSVALLESIAVFGFVLRILGSHPQPLIPFFVVPAVVILVLITPRTRAYGG